MPMMRHLIDGYRNGKLNNAQLNEITESLGLYNEFMSGAKIFEFDHELSASHMKIDGDKNIIDKVEGAGQAFAEFTLMMGGVKPLTAIFQTAHVQGVFKRMAKVAEGGKQTTAYKKMVNELGISPQMAERVYDNIRKHSSTDGLMNFKKWDIETKNVFLDGVKNRTDTLVQMQRLGDKMSWVSGNSDYMLKDTVLGKLGMELKQFVMTAYVKQLGRAVNRSDMHMIGLISSQISVLTLAYIAKQQINFAGNPEKLKKAMEPERIVTGTLGMMPQGSVLPMLLGLGTQAVLGENIFGNRHSGGVTDMITSLPTVDLVNKLVDVMGTPFELTDGIQQKDFKSAASLAGVSNSVFTRPFWEAGLDEGKNDTIRSNR